MRLLWFGIICVFLSASPCFADGECRKRTETEQEKNFFKSTLSTVRKSLPSAPSGWKMTDTNQDLGICMEAKGPQYLILRFNYTDTAAEQKKASAKQKADEDDDGKEEQTVAEFMIASKGTPGQQAQIRKLDDKLIELRKSKKQAEKNNNRTDAARLDAEIRKLSNEKSRIKKEAADAALAALQSKGSEENDSSEPGSDITVSSAEITFVINATESSVDLNDLRLERAGADTAWWSSEYKRAVILLGKWKRTKDSRWLDYAADFGSGLPDTRVQTVKIEISCSDKQQAEQFVKGMNMKALAALI